MSSTQTLRWVSAIGIMITAIGFEVALVAELFDTKAPVESWETLTATDWVRDLFKSAGIGGLMLTVTGLSTLIGLHSRQKPGNPSG